MGWDLTKAEQPKWERDFLEDLYNLKRVQQSLKSNYWSSTVASKTAQLGTVEADASGEFGRWKPEDFRAKKFAQFLVKFIDFETLLDVGPGDFAALSFFAENGKECSACEFPDSPYYKEQGGDLEAKHIYWGDFNQVEISETFDLVWASHVLEHQENPGVFLDKLVSRAKEGGYIAVIVPPRKPYIVSGHVNLFNPGLLVYRMVLAGLDCKDAKVFQFDGNICFLARKRRIVLPKLHYDVGDLSTLSKFFPFEVPEGFNGDFMHAGINDEELGFIWGKR